MPRVQNFNGSAGLPVAFALLRNSLGFRAAVDRCGEEFLKSNMQIETTLRVIH
jgi:hypothetical protein